MKNLWIICFLWIWQAGALDELSDLETFLIVKKHNEFIWVLDENQTIPFHQFTIKKHFIVHLKTLALLTFVILLPLNLNDEYTRQQEDFLQKFGHPHLYDLLEQIDKYEEVIQLTPEQLPHKIPFSFLSKIFETIANIFFTQDQIELFFEVSHCHILAQNCLERDPKIFLKTKFCIVNLLKKIWSTICITKILQENSAETMRKFNIFKDIAWHQTHFSDLPVIHQKKQFHPFLFFDYNEFVFLVSEIMKEIIENKNTNFSLLSNKISAYFQGKHNLLKNTLINKKNRHESQKILTKNTYTHSNYFSKKNLFLFRKNSKKALRYSPC